MAKKKETIETDGCNLCGNRQAHLISDSLRFGVKKNVVRCTVCHLVYLYPLMTEAEERKLYQEEYRNIADVEGHSLPQQAREFYEVELKANRQRLTRVEKFLTPESKILEIGCAAGSFLHQAKETVAECVGVELHQAFAAFVRNELGITTYDVPLEACELPPESFDAIFLFHVLEHIRKPNDYLLLLHHLLKRDGHIFIELPNIDDALVSVYKLKKYRAFYYQPAHSYYFSRRTLSRMLKKAGFKTKTIMLQRYSLLNHLNWVFHGRPQAKPSLQVSFPLALLDWPYRALLKLTGKADTLFVIGQKGK